MKLSKPLVYLLALSSIGCAESFDPFQPPPIEPAGSIDVSPLAEEGEILGVSMDGDRFDVLVDGIGIVQLDRDGVEQTRFVQGEQGFVAMRYRDLAAQGDGSFVLLADNEGFIWDAASGQHRSHFCVLPDSEWGPVRVQRNDAVALRDDVIIAAPRFYEDDALIEISLRTYRASDGVPTGTADITKHGLELQALALRDDEVLGVQGGVLHRFRPNGEHIGASTLTGVQLGTGIAVDEGTGEAWVLDAESARLVAFALDAR